MVKTPAVSERRLRTPEYLEALPLALSERFSSTGEDFTGVKIRNVRIMGSLTNVLTLTSSVGS